MNKIDNPQGLDSPLVVHKKSDSSYQANASELELNATHTQENGEELERHRFKKEKKKDNKTTPILLVVLIVLCVLFALYLTGIIGDRNNNSCNESTTEPTTETTTTIQEKYKDTIVVKGTYIFVDGYEVNGIEGLQTAVKYEDPNPRRYRILQENIDEIYYNNEILPVLTELGFYDESTEVEPGIISTGLMAEEELQTEASTEKITDDQTTVIVDENEE